MSGYSLSLLAFDSFASTLRSVAHFSQGSVLMPKFDQFWQFFHATTQVHNLGQQISPDPYLDFWTLF